MANEDDTSYCCDMLRFILDEGKISISYNQATRELSVLSKDLNYGQTISFCPFCGQKQPASLREEWEAQLDKIGYDWNDLPRGVIPKPFDTDEWWKGEQFDT